MVEDGWVADAQIVSGGGVYCRSCAHLLRIARRDEQCAWCKTPMGDESIAEATGWAYFADSLGALHPCCPVCLAEHFGIAPRHGLRRSV